MSNDITSIAGILGVVSLLISGWFGMRFYPPGEGYAQERRNNRISLVLLIAAVALIAIPASTMFIDGTP